MKKITMTISMVISLILGSVSQAFADTPYIVEPMICKGKIYGNTEQVHSSYAQILIKLNTFYSKRKDGSLALSLNVQNDYAYENTRMDAKTASWGESWFMGPMTRNGNKINPKELTPFHKLSLKVIESKVLDDGRLFQVLNGILEIKNSPAGSYGYRLKCKAIVVKKPSGVMDLTK